jgi:hypothetical protein
MMTLLLLAVLTQDKPVITVDGKPHSPAVLSLHGTPNDPKPGDVVEINGIPFVLGEEKVLAFRTTPEKEGRLFLETKDGVRVVGAKVDTTYQGRERVLVNPLAKLTDEEVRSLRGVRVDGWDDVVAARLKLVDATKAAILVTSDARQGANASLPALPANARWLIIDNSSSEGIKDYSGLGELKELRLLTIDILGDPHIDAELLAGMSELRVLDLSGTGVKNDDKLEALKELRELNLSYTKGVTNIDFVEGMPKLRRLDVCKSGITDLASLAGHKAIEWVNADMTPASRLPAGAIPTLKTLRILSTRLSDDDVADFAKANPQCAVGHRWEGSFAVEVKGVTRIRVRSGGTCHVNLAEVKTLFEVKEEAKVRAVIEGIRLDEKGSGFHCMCCGEPTIEFYKGSELVASLGFHHGRSIRWPGGWPGDALLRPDSADFLCQWLADNGIKGPLEERERGRKAAMAAARREKRYRDLLPEGVYDRMKAAGRGAAQAFEDGVPEADRLATALRLFGVDDFSWNLSTGLDEFAKGRLARASKAEIEAALVGAAKDAALAKGLARWLLGERKHGSIDAGALAKGLPDLAKAGLTHPRLISRRRTLSALGAIEGDAATRVLRSALAGEFKARALSKEDEVEPGGMVSFTGGDREVEDEVSDRAYAALLLAKRGDKESAAGIRRMLETASDHDKAVLQKALAQLE